MKEKRLTGAAICLFLILSLTACGGTEAEISGAEEYLFSEGTESDELFNEKLTTEKNSEEEKGKEESSEDKEPDSVEDEEGTAEMICVYLCGEVVHPGVYALPLGSRLCDGIDLAGGMTESACSEYWNLAELLSDGQMVYVPTEEEAEDRMLFSAAGAENGQGSGSGEGSAESGKVNINTAAADLLMTLPGIGESKANSIIAYREEHGLFQEISDIKNVAGIKDGVYNQVKDFITVD